jgi:cytochrome P450
MRQDTSSGGKSGRLCRDMSRRNSIALTFGAGIHRCEGAMLARMEMRCCTHEIVNRLRDYDLNLSGEPEICGTFVFRGPRSLPVTFKLRWREFNAPRSSSLG